MIIKETKPNEYGWYLVLKYRESMHDMQIQQKSTKHPARNSEVNIHAEEMGMLLDFMKYVIATRNVKKGERK